LIAINYLDLIVEFIPVCAVIVNREVKRSGNSREFVVAGSGHNLVAQVLCALVGGAELVECEVSGLARESPLDGFDRNIAGFACLRVPGGEHHTNSCRVETTVKRFREIEPADGSIYLGRSRRHHNFKRPTCNTHGEEFTDTSPRIGPRGNECQW
jgi:hypothetical protein